MIKDGSKPRAYRTTTLDDYIIDCAQANPGETLYIIQGGMFRPPALADMQAALEAQYGKIPGTDRCKYKAHSHGSARYVTRSW